MEGKHCRHGNTCLEFAFFCLPSLADAQYAYPNEARSPHTTGRHHKPLFEWLSLSPHPHSPALSDMALSLERLLLKQPLRGFPLMHSCSSDSPPARLLLFCARAPSSSLTALFPALCGARPWKSLIAAVGGERAKSASVRLPLSDGMPRMNSGITLVRSVFRLCIVGFIGSASRSFPSFPSSLTGFALERYLFC